MTTQEIINKYLRHEQILFSGTPQNTPLFNKWDIFMIPFTLIFGGAFIVYAVISALMMIAGQGIMFSLLGITCLLLGIYFIFLRLWYRRKRISKQIYFVTQKRVFAFDTLRDDVIFDILLEDVEVYSGDKSLILGETNAIGDFIYNLGLDIFFRKFSKETPSFRYLDDLIEVATIIKNAKDKAIKKDEDDDSLFI